MDQRILLSNPNTRNRQNSGPENDQTSPCQTMPTSEIDVVPFRDDLTPRARKVSRLESPAISWTRRGICAATPTPRACRFETWA